MRTGNLRSEEVGKDGLRIDRKTVFGNPFKIGPDGTREEVIEKHNNYFIGRLRADPVFKKAVQTLPRVTDVLLCWCAPLPCHGDNIIRYLEATDAGRAETG